MGREEQIEEREVLESIFPEELTEISETEFRIAITLDLPNDPSPPTFYLQVRYPEEYPDKAPVLDMHAVPNAPPHPYFSVADDREALLRGLVSTVEENLGMAMVFTLVSEVQSEAEELVMGRLQEKERAREEEVLAAEREENKKFHGEPVTRESFLRWREGFLQEAEEERKREEEERLAEMKKNKVKEPTKLTGRQLWERGLAGKEIDEGDDEDVEAPAEGMEKLKVGAS